MVVFCQIGLSQNSFPYEGHGKAERLLSFLETPVLKSVLLASNVETGEGLLHILR